MKKYLALLLALLMVVSMFAGCAKTAPAAPDAPAESAPKDEAPAVEESAEEAAPADDEEIVINFLGAAYSDKTEPYLKEVISAFEAQNPNVTVNLEIVGWDNIGTRMTALVGAGQAPDLYNGGSASEYVPDGLLYNVNDVVSDELKADFYPTFWENNIYPDDGEVYTLPYLASVRALYYNKAIFEEVGIEKAPTTWDEVRETCQKIIDFYDGAVYPWGLDCTTTEGQTTVAYYGWSNGGGYVDENYNYIINCPENVEAFEYINELYTKGYTNENPTLETRDDMQKMVVADKMAMLVTACFFPSLYPEKDLGVAAIPYNPANASASSTLAVQDGLLIFNGNAKQEEDSPAKLAAISAFLDFFYSPEYYVQFMVNEGMLPATQSGVVALTEQSPEQAAYLDVLAGAKFYSRNLSTWKEVTTTLIENEQNMLEGVMTPKEALDATQEVADNAG